MPTNKQRRQAAQRRLQRQLERRAELARRRRRNTLAAITVLAVLLVLGGAALVSGLGGSDDTPATAAGSSSASAGNGTPCTYTPDAAGGTAVAPPAADVPTSGTVGVTLTTSDGPIGLTLDQAAAPCAAASFVNLADQKFFDGTPCHRETDSGGLKVLQCGDPTGTGTGGPGYQFPTHVTGTETYPRGTLAMANSGQGFDGSQFFLVYGDSQLSPDYTVLGSIDAAGLDVLDRIAARGNDGSNGPGDGKPNPPGVTIQTATVQQAPTPTDGAAPTGGAPAGSGPSAPTSSAPSS